MADIAGKVGELRMVIEITRAATGEVETYELIGRADSGGNSQHGGEKRRD